MKFLSKKIKPQIKLCLLLLVLCSSKFAFGIEANKDVKSGFVSQQGLRSVLQPLLHTQANSRNSSGSRAAFRSKSEVMAEVKRRYGGQVLRISLNEQSASYSVRVLLPTGKVKNLQVSARK